MPRPLICFLACMAAILVFALLQLTPLRLVENLYEDFVVVSDHSPLGSAEDIVVIEIQETTLAGFPYRSPLDREFLANLINKLNATGAKAIGVDVFFDQASEAQKDAKLRNALLAARDKVFVPKGSRADGLSENQLAYQQNFLKSLNTTTVVLGKDLTDGVARHYLSSRQIDGQRQVQFTAAIAGVDPISEIGTFDRIRYRSDQSGKPVKFPTYPAETALVLPDSWFKDKYVLIGQNLTGIDQFRTPFATVSDERAGTLPGIQVHAHILSQLLSGEKVTELGWLGKFLFVLLGSLVGFFLPFWIARLWISLGLVIVLSAAILYAGFFAFSIYLIVLPMAAATLGLLLSAVCGSALVWQRDRAQKRFIQDAWSHYLSENVVKSLIENPDALKPGGKRIEATFIFTDIEGFTDLSEELDPEALADVVNRYLDLMIGEFQRFDTTLDKIVGDAIVGFIGAPLEDVEHANKAVSLSLSIREKSEMFRKEMQENGIQFGKTRIGINTGSAVIGNFGGSHFFDFTALGDAVNIASRLEGANKAVGGSICVSAETAKRANQHTFRPIGNLYLKGRRETVEAFEPMTDASSEFAMEKYRAAYDVLDAGSNAKEAFELLTEQFPSDHLAKFHFQRISDGETGTNFRIDK